jgi:hypothetical protein
MQPIFDLVRNIEPTTFEQADLGVQTSIVYAMVNSAHGTARSYAELLESADGVTASPEVRKNWGVEVDQAKRVSLHLMAFLHRASHAVVAEDVEVEFDSTYDDGESITGDVTQEIVAAKQHPYAWAKSKLIQRGVWPMTMDEEKGPIDKVEWHKYSDLTLWKMSAIIKKMAARTIGKWIIQIRDTGDIIPTKSAGADAIIVSMCTDIVKIGKIEDDELLSRRLASFAKSNCGGIVYVGQDKYSGFEIIQAWEDICDMDEVDDLRREVRQTGREIRRSLHTKLVQNTAFESIKASLLSLKETCKDDKQPLLDLIEGFAEQLNGKQLKELEALAAA